MPFRNLWIKEFRSIVPLFGAFSALVVLLHLLVFFKLSTWDEDATLFLGVLLPCVFGSLLALGTGYYQLHTEWRTNSIYLLLSLPIRGWKVMTAKLSAVLAGMLLMAVVIGTSFALILFSQEWKKFEGEGMLPSTLFNVVFHFFWMYMMAMVFLLALIQLAFLCGQLVAKFKWIAVLGSFLAAVWVVFRLSPLLSSLLGWMPDLVVGGQETDMIYFHSGPFLVLALMGLGLIWLNGYIFEKEVEV